MGRIAARVEPWDVPREKGRGRRGLREINSEAARSPAARARFMGRIAAREEPWDTAREKGAGQARIARNQLGSCATSCRACSLHGKDCGARGTVGYRAREGGGAGADCAESTRKLRDLLPCVLASWEGSRREWNRGIPRARRGRGRRGLREINPAAKERPRIRASFNRKNEKMEPVGTVTRRVRCRFRVLIFRQCLRCGHAFSTQPRWLRTLSDELRGNSRVG